MESRYQKKTGPHKHCNPVINDSYLCNHFKINSSCRKKAKENCRWFHFPAVGFPFELKVSGVIDSLNIFDFIEGIDEVLDLFLIFRA